MAYPIRIGVGGWSYPPWRWTFYPSHVRKADELAFASRALTAIEINATFYKRQSPDIFARWRDETPDDFVFAVKAQRFAMMRKTEADMRASINAFLDSGVTALGDKLGPINWQFPATRAFDAGYFATFLKCLPPEHDGRALQHAIEVRHASFADDAFADLLLTHGCARVCADSDDWPMDDIATAPFAYARLQRSQSDEKTGYPPQALARWVKTFKAWAVRKPVFAFVIAGAKDMNPAAAMALIKRVAA